MGLSYRMIGYYVQGIKWLLSQYQLLTSNLKRTAAWTKPQSTVLEFDIPVHKRLGYSLQLPPAFLCMNCMSISDDPRCFSCLTQVAHYHRVHCTEAGPISCEKIKDYNSCNSCRHIVGLTSSCTALVQPYRTMKNKADEAERKEKSARNKHLFILKGSWSDFGRFAVCTISASIHQ